MQSHFLLLLLFGFFVSLVFALISREDVRGQIEFGGALFGLFVVAAVILSWLMYPVPI